jgi:hypothetical protein
VRLDRGNPWWRVLLGTAIWCGLESLWSAGPLYLIENVVGGKIYQPCNFLFISFYSFYFYLPPKNFQ